MIGRIQPGAGEDDPEWIDATETHEHLLDAAASPAESRFAVTRNQSLSSALRLYWFDLGTQSYERITTTEGLGDSSEHDPVWTTDGFFFAFQRSIILIKPGDDELHTVLEEIDISDMFYRDGHHFVVASGRDDRAAGIYEATLRNGTLALQPLLVQDDIGCLDISDDASRVVFARRKR